VSLAACLLAYSLAVAVLGPPLLDRLTRSGVAPRLGVAVWTMAMGSVVASWVGAVGLLGVELYRAWGQVDLLLAGCFATLRAWVDGGHGGFLQAGLEVLIALTVLAMALLAGRLVAALRRAGRDTRRHAEAAVLATRGAPRGPGGTLVVDAAQRSVYCLAGRSPAIVITRGALDALDDTQLAAVLAHERAHLTGHHHQLLAFTSALAKILPGLRLFTEGTTQIGRLVEMRADDVAAHRHGGHTVVDALLALTIGTTVPASALGAATEPGIADRVERLLFPLDRARSRLTQSAVLGALLLVPAITAIIVLTGSPLCLTPFSA